ncbi:MAG TPA: hypothetical protein H9805_06650 [Candidatus Janibacter merdipullorum]|nr:hypothetical protein [Candidatus Janibacter merdipullorum]
MTSAEETKEILLAAIREQVQAGPGVGALGELARAYALVVGHVEPQQDQTVHVM